jgi:hypothetical protein
MNIENEGIVHRTTPMGSNPCKTLFYKHLIPSGSTSRLTPMLFPTNITLPDTG